MALALMDVDGVEMVALADEVDDMVIALALKLVLEVDAAVGVEQGDGVDGQIPSALNRARIMADTGRRRGLR
jgi:hypothetical protein